jgi:hypothetical protein
MSLKQDRPSGSKVRRAMGRRVAAAASPTPEWTAAGSRLHPAVSRASAVRRGIAGYRHQRLSQPEGPTGDMRNKLSPSSVSGSMGLLNGAMPLLRAVVWAVLAVTVIMVGLPAVLAAAV